MENMEVSEKKFDTLSKLHRVLGIPAPLHPLVSVIKTSGDEKSGTVSAKGNLNFFTIFYEAENQDECGRDNPTCADGRMLCTAPGQTVPFPAYRSRKPGTILIFHPLLLAGFELAHKIERFIFFRNEASVGLTVTMVESAIITVIFELLEKELNERLDDFSQEVIVSQIKVLLNYCNSLYERKR